MHVVIGIDVGGSTTKIVGFKEEGDRRELLEPMFVRATDPITSIYGAFGKFTSLSGLALSDIDRVMVTCGAWLRCPETSTISIPAAM